MRLVLASNSPRRQELLRGLGLMFEIRTKQDITEDFPTDLRGEEIPIHISKEKAQHYLDSLADDELLITADTIVYLPPTTTKPGHVLGKPHDEEEAKSMLRALAGRTHEVITGVTLLSRFQSRSFASTSRVTFAPLSEQEIEFYVSHFHPLDKAGAYGIQEWIGYVGVTRLEGSFYNVMGLPVQRLYEELKAWKQKNPRKFCSNA